jgi:hypothetical protein
MKCSKCGKEFGEGVNCQNCGVDRVTGLANYSNYGTSDYQGTNESSYSPSPKTTVCYACSEIIPLGSTFCPVCGKKLLVTCPNCGFEYSSQFPVCSKCGTNREEYNERKRREEEERQKKQKEWEQSPERKAELERKQKEQEKKEGIGILMFWTVFLIGGGLLFGWLDSVVDKNWLNQGLNLRTPLLTCISCGVSLGVAYLISKQFDE